MSDFLSTIDLENGRFKIYAGCTEHQGVFVMTAGDFVFEKVNLSWHSRECMIQKILNLWRKHGTNFNQFVHGNYCLAIWDPRNKELFFTHDSLGQKNIFYIQKGDLVSFSNRLELIVKGIKNPELNDDFFASWLTRSGYRSNLTPFQGVYRLSEGSSVFYKNGRRSSIKYNFDLDPQSSIISLNDAPDLLLSLVTEAVSTLASPKSNPIYELSGGLDSTTVVSIAAKLSTESPIDTFTWNSDFDDDFRYSKIAQNNLGLKNTSIKIPHINKSAFYTEKFTRYEPWDELAPDSKAHFKELQPLANRVVVSGVGGDDVFLSKGTTPYWLNDLVRKGHIKKSFSLCERSSYQRYGQRSAPYLFFKFGISPFFLNHARNDKCIRLEDSRYTSSFSNRCHEYFMSHPLKNRSKFIGTSEYFDRILHTVFHRIYPEHMDPYPKYSHPLLYQPLVKFMSHQIGVFEQTLNSDRDLQRLAFQKVLPQEILQRRSKGGSMDRDWALINEPWFEDLLTNSNSQMEMRGYLREGTLSEIIRQAKLGDFGDLYQYDFAIKGELWLRNFMRNFESGNSFDEMFAGAPLESNNGSAI